MDVSAVGSLSQVAFQRHQGPPAEVKQAFQDLGNAIDSGNLDEAKTALITLQKYAPKNGDGNNPMSQKMAALQKAVDSGNTAAAKSAWADVKQTMANRSHGRPPGGGGAQAAPPTGSAPLTNSSSSTSGTSSTNTTYDKADANKDGVVTAIEQMLYDLAHPGESSTKGSSSGSVVDTTV